jgi:hypothetical protein
VLCTEEQLQKPYVVILGCVSAAIVLDGATLLPTDVDFPFL